MMTKTDEFGSEDAENYAEKTIDIKDLQIFSDEELLKASSNIKIVSDMDWPQKKTDPTQFDYKTKTIEIKESYAQKEDPCEWKTHEAIHAYLYEYYNMKPDGQLKKQYPKDDIEYYAYINQFYRLIKKGVKYHEIMTDEKYVTIKYIFCEFADTMNDYWNEAIKFVQLQK